REVPFGTLGGACPDGPIVQVALETLESGEPRLIKVFLEDVESAVRGTVRSQTRDEIHVETNCGGVMEIYVEPYLPPDRLILVAEGGRDPLEDHLVDLGKLLDMEVVVIDHKPVLESKPDVLIEEMDYDLREFEWNKRDSVVVLTKGGRDLPVLAALAGAPVRYVGLLASRDRIAHDMKELADLGVDQAFLRRLRTPIGLDTGATTPGELALSIMAEVVATKYGRRLPRKGSGSKSKASKAAATSPVTEKGPA
ncbi:MAG: XdhC family protein, partial [Thermoplasmata archaeon]|nr:XdhC family protein [Thermoplasmata archaeon]